MSRRNEIYVSGDTWRSLWLLSEASEGVADEFGVARKQPLDQIADQILRQAIREQHPQLLQYQKKLDKLQQETIESLKTPNENNTVSGAVDKGDKS